MVGVLGARLRPALCIMHLLFECPAWAQARREAGFSFNASYPQSLSYHGLVPAPRLAFPVWPEVQCSWSVLGKGVLIRARLIGPAQSVYRAELLALVTALQGAEPGALVVSDCKSACRVVSRLWDGSRKPVGPHRDLELRLLSFP
eukprot:4060584-Amphidinium_carterae.1